MQDNGIENNNRKIAMLIDGDNAQASMIEKMLAETSKYGYVTIRQIYGDWTQKSMDSWKKFLHVYAFQPMQQFRNTTGKNATDSALIIDAMDILRDNLVDGFCIVSSDSDYTRLATRIRRSGIFVMGIGRKITPESFVKACNIFTYTENIENDIQLNEEDVKSNQKADSVKEVDNPRIINGDLLPKIMKAYEMTAREDGWASLADLGQYLHNMDPSFDTRTYHFRNLLQLIRQYGDIFERTKKDTSNLIRLKSKKNI